MYTSKSLSLYYSLTLFFLSSLTLHHLLQPVRASPSPAGRNRRHNDERYSRLNTSSNNPTENMTSNEQQQCSGHGKCAKLGLDMKEISLQMIRNDILRKLRMDENRLPNVTGKHIPQRYLNVMLDEMQADAAPRDEAIDDDHALTEKIIAFSRYEQMKINSKETKEVHYFTFSDKMTNMQIESASLYIHIKQNEHHHHSGHHDKKSNILVRILELVSPHHVVESPISIDHKFYKPVYDNGQIFSHDSRHQKTKWIQLDIKSLLAKWLSQKSTSSSRKLGLVLSIHNLDESSRDDVSIITSQNQNDINSNPFIEVYVSEIRKSRPTRNIGMTCDENSKETRCCKYPLTVDFEEMGWNWIIAPKKYEANYCSGECPFAFLQKYPHNHIVQQVGIGPCCAARKMSSISMLYFDTDQNIIFSILPGMVVDKCGCN